MSTVDAVLSRARQQIPASEARLLLSHCLTRDPGWLVAHGEAPLGPREESAYSALVARRAGGEPVAYLLGRREFYGRDFVVAPGVLIPRPETELLVETTLSALKEHAEPRVLELGTGSGCIAITLSLECPAARVTAVDVSSAALAVARDNAGRLGAAVDFVESDWFAALRHTRFDLVVSNPPYIAEDDGHLGQGDLRFEPLGALVSGKDGLDAIRHIIGRAPHHLAPGGWLLLEHGHDQSAALRHLLETHGYRDIGQYRDLAGILRVSGGRCA